MKRFLCTGIALLILLTACSAPEQSAELSGAYTHGLYEFTFDVEQLSGGAFDEWDFVYTYNGKEIRSGHQILFSLEIFSFRSVRVDVIERDAPNNRYSVTFPVEICDGGSGKAEITAIGSDSCIAAFRITCLVTKVGKRRLIAYQ